MTHEARGEAVKKGRENPATRSAGWATAAAAAGAEAAAGRAARVSERCLYAEEGLAQVQNQGRSTRSQASLRPLLATRACRLGQTSKRMRCTSS